MTSTQGKDTKHFLHFHIFSPLHGLQIGSLLQHSSSWKDVETILLFSFLSYLYGYPAMKCSPNESFSVEQPCWRYTHKHAPHEPLWQENKLDCVNLVEGGSTHPTLPLPFLRNLHDDLKARKGEATKTHVPRFPSDHHNKLVYAICLLRRLESAMGGKQEEGFTEDNRWKVWCTRQGKFVYIAHFGNKEFQSALCKKPFKWH